MIPKFNSSQLAIYALPDFIDIFPEIAHVKDTKKFLYTATNRKNLEIFNFSSKEDLLGKSVFDLERLMGNKWPPQYAEIVHAQDERVVRYKKPICFQPKPFLSNQGYLIVHSFMKIPLLGINSKISNILTLVFDRTSLVSTKKLFSGYHELYSEDLKLANKKFLEHIGLNLKNTYLTTREIECLISLAIHRKLVSVSEDLKISPKTLDTHLSHIRQKMNYCNLKEILQYFMIKNYQRL